MLIRRFLAAFVLTLTVAAPASGRRSVGLDCGQRCWIHLDFRDGRDGY